MLRVLVEVDRFRKEKTPWIPLLLQILVPAERALLEGHIVSYIQAHTAMRVE